MRSLSDRTHARTHRLFEGGGGWGGLKWGWGVHDAGAERFDKKITQPILAVARRVSIAGGGRCSTSRFVPSVAVKQAHTHERMHARTPPPPPPADRRWGRLCAKGIREGGPFHLRPGRTSTRDVGLSVERDHLSFPVIPPPPH